MELDGGPAATIAGQLLAAAIIPVEQVLQMAVPRAAIGQDHVDLQQAILLAAALLSQGDVQPAVVCLQLGRAPRRGIERHAGGVGGTG
ncbi:hypothetical protein D3C71_1890290 [compost metagenome]